MKMTVLRDHCHFRFASQLLLTPIIRQTTDEPVPMALIDAPLAGTGKGLLGEVTALIATGRPAGTTPR
jgi:hypothetical protein